MNKKEQEILFTVVGIAVIIGILAFAIRQFQDFIDANSWMHIILAIFWYAITIWMGFLTYKDIKEGSLGWIYGLQNLWKPAFGIVTFIWAISQTWTSFLNYPWLVYIPFGIVTLIIIFYITRRLIHYLKNRKNIS